METSGGSGGAVLCAIDGSKESLVAAQVGKNLAEWARLRLVLVSVEAPVTAPGVSAAAYGQERLAEQERREADEFLHAAAEEIGVADAKLRVELGPTASCILGAAEDERAEFIVMGTRGRSGVRAVLLGSASMDVATQATCPVVLVPHV
jgi:nucleotide-binding universal stress UspA family protein